MPDTIDTATPIGIHLPGRSRRKPAFRRRVSAAAKGLQDAGFHVIGVKVDLDDGFTVLTGEPQAVPSSGEPNDWD
jgi:hypothetical protein